MRVNKIPAHLHGTHTDESNKPFEYFKDLKAQHDISVPVAAMNGSTGHDRRLYVKGMISSYEISDMIAKAHLPHTVGEVLIKPAVGEVLSNMTKDANKKISLTIYLCHTVSRRIDEMTGDLMHQLLEKLWIFTLDFHCSSMYRQWYTALPY